MEAQTVQLLAAQLSTKLSSPTELHGQVMLEGPNYFLAIEKSDVRRGLSASDRQSIAKLLQLPVERPDLRLQITLAPGGTEGEGAKAPLLWRQVKTMLARSRLKPSQWAIQGEQGKPPKIGGTAPYRATATSSETKSTEPAAPPAVRCIFRLYQEF